MTRPTSLMQAVFDHLHAVACDCVRPLPDKPGAYEELPPLGVFVSLHSSLLGQIAPVLSVLTSDEKAALLSLYAERRFFRGGERLAGTRRKDHPHVALLSNLAPYLATNLGDMSGATTSGVRFALTPLGYLCAYLLGGYDEKNR